jgi:hypothetical protein
LQQLRRHSFHHNRVNILNSDCGCVHLLVLARS